MTQKIPYIIVVGDKEIESKSVALRKRGSKDTVTMSIDEFVILVQQKNDAKELSL